MTEHNPWAALGDDPFAARPARESVRWHDGVLRIGDQVRLAVTIDDDPGADLGMLRQPGHRFFFTLNDVEAVAAGEGT